MTDGCVCMYVYMYVCMYRSYLCFQCWVLHTNIYVRYYMTIMMMMMMMMIIYPRALSTSPPYLPTFLPTVPMSRCPGASASSSTQTVLHRMGMYVCIYMYVCMYVYIHIYVCIYVCIHTKTHSLHTPKPHLHTSPSSSSSISPTYLPTYLPGPTYHRSGFVRNRRLSPSKEGAGDHAAGR